MSALLLAIVQALVVLGLYRYNQNSDNCLNHDESPGSCFPSFIRSKQPQVRHTGGHRELYPDHSRRGPRAQHLGLVRILLVILAFISSSLFPLSSYTVTILFIALVLEGQVSKHICVFHSRALVL